MLSITTFQTSEICALRLKAIVLFCVLVTGTGGCSKEPTPQNPRPSNIALLGEMIFSDPRLSADGLVSCATCHDPTLAFTDGLEKSIGVGGRTGTRNSTSLLDVAAVETFFWDGRENDLEKVVLQPFTNPVELGNSSLADIEVTLASITEYREQFAHAFGRAPERQAIAQALVAFIHSVESGTTRLERYLLSGDTNLLSPDELAGLDLFRDKAKCSSCHVVNDKEAPLTDHGFHRTGIGFERISGRIAPLMLRVDASEQSAVPLGQLVLENPGVAELGRFIKTSIPSDIGSFRTPTLRNVANTAPYMHDGSVKTLSAAIERELYYRTISEGKPISLTVEEKNQLLDFLHALSIDSQRQM